MSPTPCLDELNQALSARGVHAPPLKVICALFAVLNRQSRGSSKPELNPWLERVAAEAFRVASDTRDT